MQNNDKKINTIQPSIHKIQVPPVDNKPEANTKEVKEVKEIKKIEPIKPAVEQKLPEIKPNGPVNNPVNKPEVKPIVKLEQKTEQKPEVKSEQKPEIKPVIKPEVKIEAKPEIKAEVKPVIKPVVNAGVKPELNKINVDVKKEVPSLEKKMEEPKPKLPTIDNQEKKPMPKPVMPPVVLDDLADKVQVNSHGLTDEQIKQMDFGEILKVILEDTDVTDVSYNGHDVYVQHNRKGRYKFSSVVDSVTVGDFVRDIANNLNEYFNNEHPIIDVEMKDLYSKNKNAILRLNAVHESVSPFGNTLAIRITLPTLRLTENDSTFAPLEIFKLIQAMIRGNLNILISGRTGSGKTELQKFLVNYIRDVEKIVLIEDTKDTNLKELYAGKDILSWVTNDRVANPIDFDELIRSSLRNNPDWIIISETRGSEAYSMIKSGLSGHKIITTLHSDSADSNVDRLIHMCKEKYDLDQLLLGKMITDVFDIGIHIDYDITLNGTKRYICEIVEYRDYTPRGVVVNPIFTLKSKPVRRPDGTITYEKVGETGKISKELFDKLAKKKVLSKDIDKFIEEDYYGKEFKDK